MALRERQGGGPENGTTGTMRIHSLSSAVIPAGTQPVPHRFHNP